MKIIIDGLATEYKDEGQGRVLLFLHGWKDSLHTFDQLTPYFSKDFRVIRLDLPGFGNTEMAKGTWELEDYINFVGLFIDKLDLQAYTLVGHSLGGRIVVKGVAEGKLKPAKIVLIGAAGIAKRKTFKNYFFKIIAKIGKTVTYIPPFYFFRDTLKKKFYGSIGSDYLNAGVLKSTFQNIIKEDLVKYAKKIQTPALLIWGREDTETPVTDGYRYKDLIKDSEIKVLEDCGHFVHKEKPKEIAQYIRDFIC